MAASGSAAARSHCATPSALACGMATNRTSKRATQRIPPLALGLSTLRLASLVQYFSVECDAVHNRQRPLRGAADVPASRERGTAEPFRVAYWAVILYLYKKTYVKKEAGDLGTYPAAPDPTVVCKNYCFCSGLRVHALLLDRHAGGVERRHDGRIAVDGRNRRENRRTVTGPPAKPAASSTLVRPQKAAAGELTRR